MSQACVSQQGGGGGDLTQDLEIPTSHIFSWSSAFIHGNEELLYIHYQLIYFIRETHYLNKNSQSHIKWKVPLPHPFPQQPTSHISFTPIVPLRPSQILPPPPPPAN